MVLEQVFLPVFWVSSPSIISELGKFWIETNLRFFFRRVRRLRKATHSFLLSVRPSAWNNSAHTGRIVMKILNLIFFFENLQRKFEFHLKSDKNNGCFTWITMNSLMISHPVLLRMRNVLDKTLEKIQTHILCSINFLKNIAPFMSRCGKIWLNWKGHRWKSGAFHAEYVRLQTHTRNM